MANSKGKSEDPRYVSDLGDMGNRGTILLPMTYDPPNNKGLQAWGIDPTLRGSVLYPGDRQKSSR